jgi:hypothetical protein
MDESSGWAYGLAFEILDCTGCRLVRLCKKVAGLSLKNFLDRFAAQAFQWGFNWVAIDRLFGRIALIVNRALGGKCNRSCSFMQMQAASSRRRADMPNGHLLVLCDAGLGWPGVCGQFV